MLLVYALCIFVVAYIIARLLGQFLPGAASVTWVVYAVAGLIVLVLALRLFAPSLRL